MSWSTGNPGGTRVSDYKSGVETIKTVLPALDYDKHPAGLPRFIRDMLDKVGSMRHGRPLIKLYNQITGQTEIQKTSTPSFLMVPELDDDENDLNDELPGTEVNQSSTPLSPTDSPQSDSADVVDVAETPLRSITTTRTPDPYLNLQRSCLSRTSLRRARSWMAPCMAT